MIKVNMTVEEAVKVNPALVDIMSDLGIDFCCGGKRPLKEAIIEKNLDVNSTLDIFNRKIRDTGFERLDIEKAMRLDRPELIEYIISTHHRREEALIPEIDSLLDKILHVHYEHHGEELSKIYTTFLHLKGELAGHFAKEEKIIFPLMREMDDERVHELEDEHEAAGELLHSLERLTDKFTVPADGCRTYQLAFKKLKELAEDIHIHIFLENSVLFKDK